MSICFGPLIDDRDRDLFARPLQARADLDNHELSLCNTNGVDLLLALGLAPAP